MTRIDTITIYDWSEDAPLDEFVPADFIGPPDVSNPPDEVRLVVPAKREVCDRCDGDGVHDHAAFSNGLTSEDFAGDPDFREDYLRGAYNVRCSECKGKRVVDAPDWDRMTERQQTLADDYYQDMSYNAAEAAAERRMGY